MKFLFLLLILIVSCSKQSPSARKLAVSRASITDSDFKGGVLFKMTNLTTLVSTTVELTAAPFTVLIADGRWKFEFVGFMGADLWSGAPLCGEVTLDLIPTTLFIDITPNAVNCTSADFAALIATKVTGASKWDSAVWDSPDSKWAP